MMSTKNYSVVRMNLYSKRQVQLNVKKSELTSIGLLLPIIYNPSNRDIEKLKTLFNNRVFMPYYDVFHGSENQLEFDNCILVLN